MASGATDSGAMNAAARARSNPWLAAARIFAIVFVTLPIYLAYLVVWLPSRRERRLRTASQWMHAWVKVVARIAGIRAKLQGNIPPAPAMLTPNHMGYADVLALTSLFPVFFAPKAEMADWPVLGHLTNISGNVFLSRRRGRHMQTASQQIADRLRLGYRVCVFLEGTSTGGDRVMLFKPPMLQSAIDLNVPLVPVGIRWRSDHARVDPSEDIAYWKDHTIGPHIFRLFGFQSVEAEIRFGEPTRAEGRDRKAVAAELRAEVLRLCELEHAADRVDRGF